MYSNMYMCKIIRQILWNKNKGVLATLFHPALYIVTSYMQFSQQFLHTDHTCSQYEFREYIYGCTMPTNY